MLQVSAGRKLAKHVVEHTRHDGVPKQSQDLGSLPYSVEDSEKAVAEPHHVDRIPELTLGEEPHGRKRAPCNARLCTDMEKVGRYRRSDVGE